jgi:hypothetical protein
MNCTRFMDCSAKTILAYKPVCMLRNYTVTVLIMFLFAACTGNHNQDPVVAAAQKPKAFEKGSSYSAKRSYQKDFLNDIYQEQLGRSAALKTLDNDLNLAQQKLSDSAKAFHEFDNNIEGFYRDANSHLAGIRDETLRNRISALISTGKENYAQLTETQRGLLQQALRNDSSLQDLHEALKIVVALPLVAAYEKNQPAISPLQNILIEQGKLQQQVMDTINRK